MRKESGEVKTYGYDTKRKLPAISDGKPKVCPRCSKWFLAEKRQRICLGCMTPAMRAKLALKDALSRSKASRGRAPAETSVNAENMQVRAYRILTFSEVWDERLTWVSQACKYPRQPQAEHLPSARQHPSAGDRPEESGWCTGACNCTCHIKVYEGMMA
jgi:hypothetical protein